MNLIHGRICRSEQMGLPDALAGAAVGMRGLRLDGDVLEIGPGYGVTTRWLLMRGARLTAVEIDPD